LSGAEGFEPPNAGSKSRYLAEMRMKNIGLLDFIFFEISIKGARKFNMCDKTNLSFLSRLIK